MGHVTGTPDTRSGNLAQDNFSLGNENMTMLVKLNKFGGIYGISQREPFTECDRGASSGESVYV